MIVGLIPGEGHTIKNARVVLKPDETLPNRYNVPQAEVLRMDPVTYEEILIKPVGSVFPPDHEILSNPEIVIGSILTLTADTKGGSIYEHQDIIRLDSSSEDSDSDGGPNDSGSDPVVS